MNINVAKIGLGDLGDLGATNPVDACNVLTTWDLMFGDTSACNATSQSGIRQIPAACALTPFADFMDACKPFSNTELESMLHQNLQQVAAVNPPLAQSAETAINQEMAQIAAANPSDTCKLNAAVNFPTLSAMFGSGIVCSMGGGNDQGAPGYTPYLIVGGIVAAAVFVAMTLGKRR